MKTVIIVKTFGENMKTGVFAEVDMKTGVFAEVDQSREDLDFPAMQTDDPRFHRYFYQSCFCGTGKLNERCCVLRF